MVFKESVTFLSIIYVVLADEPGQCPNITTRLQWGARRTNSINYLIVPIPYVVINDMVTESCTQRNDCAQRVANIQTYHMDSRNLQDIAYSFLIGGDGNVYEGRGWIREGEHTSGYNKKSVGIAFIGSYQDGATSQRMLDAAHKLIACGKAQGVLRSKVHVISAPQDGEIASSAVVTGKEDVPRVTAFSFNITV